MQFKDIRGAHAAKEYLQGVIADNRIPHALLLHGRSGNAKYALALAAAQMIVCNDIQGQDSCGVCKACTKAEKLVHPDIHFVFPVIKKDNKKREETTSQDFLREWRQISLEHPYFSFEDWSEKINVQNSLPNINTRECHEILKKLSLRSFESEYKVMVIWMPEYLGKEGNRLLKIIEEPTDKTVLLIVAEDLNRILNTILSRTQTVHVPPFTDDQIIDYLQDQFPGMNIEALRQKSVLADGSMATAMRAQGEEDYSDLFFQWIRSAYKSHPKDLLPLVDKMARLGRNQQREFLQYGLTFLREYHFYLCTSVTGKRMSTKEQEVAEKMRSVINLEKAALLRELLEASIIHIGRNAHARVSFMADSLSIGKILKNEPIIVIQD